MMSSILEKIFASAGHFLLGVAQVINSSKHSELERLVKALRVYGYKYQVDTRLARTGLQYFLYTSCVGMSLNIPLGDYTLDSILKYLRLQLNKQEEKRDRKWKQTH